MSPYFEFLIFGALMLGFSCGLLFAAAYIAWVGTRAFGNLTSTREDAGMKDKFDHNTEEIPFSFAGSAASMPTIRADGHEALFEAQTAGKRRSWLSASGCSFCQKTRSFFGISRE